MTALRKDGVSRSVKRHVYERVTDEPMVDGHWTVRHAPPKHRIGPFSVADSDESEDE